jgi:hypothetical protein
MPKKASKQHSVAMKRGLGGMLGGLLGSLGSKIFPIPGIDGGSLGQTIGNLLPFARGGMAMRGGMAPPVKRKGGRAKKGGKK